MLGLDNPLHILLVLVVVLLVFGAKRLPEMGKSLGEGLRGFKSSISDEHNDAAGPESGVHPLSSLSAAPTAPTAPDDLGGPAHADSHEPATDAERAPQPVA